MNGAMDWNWGVCALTSIEKYINFIWVLISKVGGTTEVGNGNAK